MSATIRIGDTVRVEGHGAVAWHVDAYATEWTEEKWEYIPEWGPEDDQDSWAYLEPEQIEDSTRVDCHMIGDDRTFTFELDELVPLAREDYCGECGQIGCTHDAYDRG